MKVDRNSPAIRITAFTAILIVGIVLRILLFSGLQGSDDLQYTHNAYQFLDGGFNSVTDDVTKTRLLSYIPVSLFFYLLGVNEISAVLYPLVCSIGLLLLVYKLGALLFDDKTALLAMALYACFPIEVIHATMLYPELPMGLLMGLSMYCFLTVLKHPGKNENLLLFLAGVLVACAYMVKITAVLLLGVYCVYFLCYKRNVRAMLLLGAGLAVVIAAESLFYYSQNGDFLFQYHLPQQIAQQTRQAIVDNAGTLNYLQQKNMGWYRAFIYYPGIMFATIFTFSFYYHGVFMALGYLIWKRVKETYPIVMWFMLLLLALNFGFQSLNPLIFIPSSPRYLMVLSIPLVLLLGYVLGQARTRRWRIAATTAMTVLILTSAWALKEQYAHGVPQTCANARALYQFLNDKDKPIYVDPRTRQELVFLDGYKNTLQLMDYGPETTFADLGSVSDAYVIINRQWINRVELWYALEFPPEVSTPPAHWELIQSYENPFRELNVGIIAALKSLVGMQSSAAAQTLAREQDINAYIYYVPAAP